MGMQKSITEMINRLCNQLDTNPFLGKEQKESIQQEIIDLVEKRQRLIDVYSPKEVDPND